MTTKIISAIKSITEIKELENIISVANQHLEELQNAKKIQDAKLQIKSQGYYLDLDNKTSLQLKIICIRDGVSE